MNETTVWIVSGIVILCLVVNLGLLAYSIRDLLKMDWSREADWDARLEDDLHE